MVDGAALSDATLETSVPGLKLIPSHVDLAGAELEIGDRAGRTTILRDAINEVSSQYDYVLIDCPPSLNLLTVNALSASRSVHLLFLIS